MFGCINIKIDANTFCQICLVFWFVFFSTNPLLNRKNFPRNREMRLKAFQCVECGICSWECVYVLMVCVWVCCVLSASRVVCDKWCVVTGVSVELHRKLLLFLWCVPNKFNGNASPQVSALHQRRAHYTWSLSYTRGAHIYSQVDKRTAYIYTTVYQARPHLQPISQLLRSRSSVRLECTHTHKTTRSHHHRHHHILRYAQTNGCNVSHSLLNNNVIR